MEIGGGQLQNFQKRAKSPENGRNDNNFSFFEILLIMWRSLRSQAGLTEFPPSSEASQLRGILPASWAPPSSLRSADCFAICGVQGLILRPFTSFLCYFTCFLVGYSDLQANLPYPLENMHFIKDLLRILLNFKLFLISYDSSQISQIGPKSLLSIHEKCTI